MTHENVEDFALVPFPVPFNLVAVSAYCSVTEDTS